MTQKNVGFGSADNGPVRGVFVLQVAIVVNALKNNVVTLIKVRHGSD